MTPEEKEQRRNLWLSGFCAGIAVMAVICLTIHYFLHVK